VPTFPGRLGLDARVHRFGGIEGGLDGFGRGHAPARAARDTEDFDGLWAGRFRGEG